MAKYTFVDNEGFQVVTAFIDGDLKTITSDHPYFDEVFNRLKVGNEEGLAELFDPAEKISRAFAKVSEQVAIKDGRVLFEGEEVRGLISDHILKFYDQGLEDYAPIVKFLEKIKQNPQEESRNMAYDWILQAGLTINKDGDVIGYKGVRRDFTSVNAGPAIVNGEEFNGHVPNDPGNVIEMPRASVTFDPNNSCASGLHVGTFDHARGFGSGGHILELAVNPRDIVSVPSHDTTKMRVCRYRVVDSIENPYEVAYVDSGFDEDWEEDDLLEWEEDLLDDLDEDDDEWDDIEEEGDDETEEELIQRVINYYNTYNVSNLVAKADTTQNYLNQKRGPDGKFIKG